MTRPATRSTPFVVPSRFHGPSRSGNGGWSAGALAERLPPLAPGRVATVTLRLPPPLDTPLAVTTTEDGVVALADGRTVAEARAVDADLRPVPAVTTASAADAASRYRGFRSHPFPTCFTCGPDRPEGEGLRIFAGPVADDPARVAATWTPYEVSVPITWAALDCPGGWASDVDERPMVLGTITARIVRAPVSGERYVVVGEERAREGRKTFTASSLYDEGGELCATAEHVWIAIDPQAFL